MVVTGEHTYVEGACSGWGSQNALGKGGVSAVSAVQAVLISCGFRPRPETRQASI